MSVFPEDAKNQGCTFKDFLSDSFFFFFLSLGTS